MEIYYFFQNNMKSMNTKILIFACTLLLLLTGFSSPHAGPLPDTRQTQCYDSSAEIPCPVPGEPFFGQDGNYTINPPSYTKLDDAGNALPDASESWSIVRDNLTGLIWEVKTDDGTLHDKDNTYTWYDNNPDTNGGVAGTSGNDTDNFINALNAENFGGVRSWRLPTVKELTSIVNWDRTFPALDASFFPQTQMSSYWSATTYAGSVSSAWIVHYYNGDTRTGSKSQNYFARAVHGGQSELSEHLVDNGDGTLTDASTGLMWQQDSGPKGSWESALAYCENSTTAGYADWRLPNITELQSIADYSRFNPAVVTAAFPETASDYYWSATTYAGSAGYAWYVNFSSGDTEFFSKSYANFVRAVRGGQNRLSGRLFISAPQQADRWGISSQMPIIWDTQSIGENVKIMLSRDGGKTYETLTESTENDGFYAWTVSGALSVNCILRIEPLGDASKGTSQGLFSIAAPSPPDPPSAPTPPHRLSYVSTDAKLSWSCGHPDTGITLTYDIYFGAANPPPPVASDQSTPIYDPGILADNTLYYWKIVARDNYGSETEGPLWTFDTGYDAAGDSDEDGMMDNWEIVHFGNLTHDGTADTDADDLSDLVEYQLHTNPYNPDTDNDGMPDSWEASNSLNPNVNDAGKDADGDGFTNGREYQDRTDPNNPASHLVLPQATGRIPDTGQTKCYDNSIEFPCPPTEGLFYGQDGNYAINPPSYVKMDAQGYYLPDNATSWVTVRDRHTGLIWEVKTDDGSIHDKDNTYTWCDSNPDTNGGSAGTCGDGTDTEDFINALNSANFGGYSDWRLPTVKELSSIIDSGYLNPSVNTSLFPNTQPGYYWTTTTNASSYTSAWSVIFSNGGGIYGAANYKSNSQYVRAVRGKPTETPDRFVVNGDGTVTDKSTGLMWAQKTDDGGANDKDNTYTWEQALAWIKSLSDAAYLGYNDWRLPNRNELQSLADYTIFNPSINTAAFPHTKPLTYWSSTTSAANTSNAQRTNFGNGLIDSVSKMLNDSSYARAVRGGQPRLPDHLVISAPQQGARWVAGNQMAIVWETSAIVGNVKISLSRDGGKTFESITGSTENDGSYDWTVADPVSANCMLKIEPLQTGYADQGTTQGLFSIASPVLPAAAVSGSPDSLTSLNDLILTVGGDSIISYKYKLDEGVYGLEILATLPIELTDLPDGSHLLSIIGRNAAGDWQSTDAPTTLSWTIDTTPPAAPDVSGPAATNNTIPAWTWVSGGGGSGTFRHKLDDDDFNAGFIETSQTEFTPDIPLAEGAHTLYVQERDAAGNWSNSGSFTIEVDNGKPCSAAASPLIVDDLNKTITITYTRDDIYAGETCGNASSGSGLAKVELWAKGPADQEYLLAATGQAENMDGQFQLSGVTDGAYRFYTRAIDRAGNTEDLPEGGFDTQTLFASQFAGYAILSVGSIAGQEGLDAHTLTANNIYRHLVNRNFTLLGDPTDPLDHIKYFNPYNAETIIGKDDYTINPDNPGGPAIDYKPALEKAITGWALNKMNMLAGPLYIILINHGTPDAFSLTATSHFSAQELNGWLNALEEGLPQDFKHPIVLILGTCYSGSFIDDISKPGRIVITSTDAYEPSYRGTLTPTGVRDGEFFMSALFNELGQGVDFKTGFEQAVQQTKVYTDSGLPNSDAPYDDSAMQHPHLDDNGDGEGSHTLNPGGDGELAGALVLGNGTSTPEPVKITAVGKDPEAPLAGTGALLWATVSDQNRTADVWMEIRGPDLILAGGDTQQVIFLPKASLSWNDSETRYEAIYNGFTTPGRYTLFFHAGDADGIISPFAVLTVYSDWTADLADAILVLQILAVKEPAAAVHKEADVNGDGRIGLEEAIFILQKVSGLRP